MMSTSPYHACRYLIGHIPLDRLRGGKPVLDTCAEMLDQNCPVFFFPEGTRGRDDALQSFKPGAFVLALRKNIPVVPITIINTAHLMPPGNEFWKGGLLRKGDITVIIHAPIYPKYKPGLSTAQDLSVQAKAAISGPLQRAATQRA